MNFYILLLPIFSNFGFISCKDTFRFASHYADHMVLQRDPNAAVLWGFGEENAQVTVSIGGKLIQATAEKGEQFYESSLRILTGKKHPQIKPMKNINMNIWVVGTSNQLFIRVFNSKTKLLIK